MSSNAVPLDIHDNAVDAGVYGYVGEVWFYDDRVSPGDVREIRESGWPNYVPLKCRRIFKSPAGTEEAVDYCVIGSYIEHPTEQYKDDYIELQYVPRELPQAWAHKIQALRILKGEWEKGSTEWKLCSPDPPLKFGKWVIEQMKAARKFFDPGIRIEGEDVMPAEWQADKTHRLLAILREKDDKDVERGAEEAKYRIRHNWPQMKKAVEEGRITPKPSEPSTFVDLGGR